MSDQPTTGGPILADVQDEPLEQSRREREIVEESAGVLPAAFGGFGSRAPRRRGRILVGVAIGWLILIVLLAVFADLLPLRDPDAVPITTEELAAHPHMQHIGFRLEFLGTDQLGRSNLSRVIYGARPSLAIGALAALGGVAAGLVIGLLGAFFGGFVDTVVMFYINTMQACPPLILLLALAAILKPNIVSLALILAFIAVPAFARIVRANAIAARNREYVQAARALGASRFRLLTRELFPVVFRAILSYVPIVAATLIVAEASLSFLGLGIPPPTPTWGGMIADGQAKAVVDPSHFDLVLIPAIAFFFTVFSMNVVGDWGRARMSRRTSL